LQRIILGTFQKNFDFVFSDKLKNKQIPNCWNNSKIPHCWNNSKIPHCWRTIPKYHTVGTIPKYHTVGTIPKYHTVGTIPKSNIKIVERGKFDTSNKFDDRSLSCLSTDTSLKSDRVKLVLWA
jgi:hypothetical protein